ncbi:MAG TPA: response regulator [Methylomirabilota bacterium]
MIADSLRHARILVVDDEPANVLLLQRLLGDAGYAAVTTTTDSRRVLELYRSTRPDLIVLDLMMPHLDGIAVLEQLRAEIPADTYVPVLVLTADATLEAKRRALASGARDFLTKPFEQFEALLRIKNLLETRQLHVALEQQNRSLEETVRQRTERLMQSEKVAAMGSLLAGVAHELNNPLTVLSGQAQLLEGTADAGLARRAGQIRRAADRCVRIVRNFLSLARQHPPERMETSLTQVARGALELLAYELRTDDVELVVELPDNLPVLWADPHQLHQVLVNIIANAHHAMRRQPGPKRITIRARHAGGRVRVEIADTGRGIPPEILSRIFEPFFTTKPAGEGTGLGLSLCRSIVEEHGGTITVESVPGRGTTFGVELPVVTPPSTAARTAAPAAPAAAAARVLIVDDEEGVAEVVAEAIGQDGHETRIANHGAGALDLLAQGRYDAIVSDTKMPVMDGEGFFGELVRRFPGMRQRIVFLTGDVLSREKRAFLESTGAPVLLKPCDLDEVRRVVNSVLARGR